MLRLLPFLIFPLLFFTLLSTSCNREDDNGTGPNTDQLQLVTAQIGGTSILSTSTTQVPFTSELTLGFNQALAALTFADLVTLTDESGEQPTLTFDLRDQGRILAVQIATLQEGQTYTLLLSDQLEGADGASFPGATLSFEVEAQPLKIVSLSANEVALQADQRNTEIPLAPTFELTLNLPIPPQSLEEVVLVGDAQVPLQITQQDSVRFTLQPTAPLNDFTKYNLLFSSSLGTVNDRPFETVSYTLYTKLDTTPKFPIISEEELLTLVQSKTFKYFWDFGHPVSGLARERNTSLNTVTSGGSGFGLMAMIVGVERGFISRQEAVDRWVQVLDFLEGADRFHGVYAHWMNGNTGDALPFSPKDNGGDLVETAFLFQGLLTVRQYLDASDPTEADLIARINTLWEEVEWDWYTQGGQNVLTWHWSPDFGWDINLKIRGHNETQIIYILAAASPTHPISKEVYDQGYARSGDMQNGNTYYGLQLPLGSALGGPLFFAHYSYLGLDPRNLQDQYANYWTQNIRHTLINRAYCIDNPQNYVGYSEDCWGLTASDNESGYSAHSPTNDRGVITPTAALSSFPYTPEESMAALEHFYYSLGDRLWGEYGFYDAFNPTEGWVASSYLAIDQGPIVCMIENHRTGLLWDLFMTAPEVQDGLDKLDITY